MMKRVFVWLFPFLFITPYSWGQNAWINEFHYDNVSTDQNEFIEVVIENPGSYNLSDFQLDLYNGNGGASYDNETIDNFTVGNTIGNYTFYTWEPSSIQNGDPDGLCLSYNGTVISGQFLSYEGTFTATDGPANGITSTNIGVSESSSTQTDESLQLSGTGSQYSDFTWQSPATNTKGSINNNQTFSNISGNSDIIKKSGWNEPTNIDYTLYDVTSGLTTTNSIEVAKFTIRDGGGTNDSDGVSTTLTDISIDIDKYENIQAIAIIDGTTNVAELTGNDVDATVDFSGLSIVAPDDGEKDFSIYVTFKTEVTDNDNLLFTIASATSSGSGFADPDAGGAETDNTGDNNKIVVTADRLIITAPGSVIVNYNFTVTIHAADQNNNTDLDQTSSVTLSLYSGSGTLSAGSGLTHNLNSGTYQWTDLQYDVIEVFNIEAQSASFPNIISNDINAIATPYIDLIISEVADPENPSSGDYAKFVEIFNAGNTTVDFGVNDWYLAKRENGTGIWKNVQLDPTASLAPGDTWVVAYNYANAFYDAYDFYADQESSFINGNGDDPYFLFYGGDNVSGTLIDIYGVSGVDGTGEDWEYKDSKAVRKRSIVTPSSIWIASEWVIIPAYESEVTPDWHDKDLTWNGGSSDWSDINNWTGNGTLPKKYPPDAGCDLTIPDLANDPDISGRASCNNMTIESGAVVTVEPDHFLVTGSQITNNTGVGGLIVESDATGDGMLLLGSGTTQATVKRYLVDDMSHFISAPITDATADNLYQDHNPEVYLYEFHENDDSYNYLVPTSTPMPSGKGFSTWVDDAASDYIIANFDGSLMSSDLTLNGSTTPSLEYTDNSHGWNLVGNPYPVPIDWTKGSWDSTNVEGTIYIWDPDVNNTNNPDGTWVWKTTAGGGTSTFYVIPGGQAFFVRTQAAGASLTIPADARTVYHVQDYYKSPREDEEDSIAGYPADYVIVKAVNDQDEDEVWISFNEYGTEGFDNGWDASKMFNSYNTLSLYVPKETRDQCLEHLPPLEENEDRVVAVNFSTTVDGEASLILDMTHMPETVDIMLEDLKYGQMQHMEYDSVYHFVAFTDDDPDRFRIHFNRTTTGIEFQELNTGMKPPVHIYAFEKNIYIEKEDPSATGNVMVYDLFGRQILSQPLERTSLMKIPVNMNSAYLIVKVISNNKVTTSKVFIR